MLRGKKPSSKPTRLKALLFGPAGVGKTTAAIQMPKPYVIDCEAGCAHYGKIIEDHGGVVFETNRMSEIINEVRALSSEKHDYLTLVIDPFTACYEVELERAEKVVGSDFGRHYGEANKTAKRLFNLISQLDMNVIFSCHSKNEYGDSMKVTGQTYDGWKKLDYLFDAVFQLTRGADKKKRQAFVKKSRLEAFPDQSTFEWSYDELSKLYGKEKLEKVAEVVSLATENDVDQFKLLYGKLDDATIKKLKIDKAVKSVDDLSDMPLDRIQKGIEIMRDHLTP